MKRLSERQPSVAAELGLHHAFFPLSRGDSKGDLYHQLRGDTASLVAQDHQNAGSFSQRSAETAVSADPAGVQKVDHAGAKLEPALKLLHRAVARSNAQDQVGWHNASQFFSTWTQGKGNCPLPLQPIPNTNNNSNTNTKNNANTNNEAKVVYTERLTDRREDVGMSKASTWMLEKGTQVPSPSPDLIPAGDNELIHPGLSLRLESEPWGRSEQSFVR